MIDEVITVPKRVQRFDPRQKMHSDTFEVFHYLDLESRHLDAHFHDFYEVFYFIGGDVDYWIDGSVYSLKPGDILLIRPTELHKPVPRDVASANYERIVLWLEKSYLENLEDGIFTACFAVSAETKILRPSRNLRGQLMPLFEQLVREFYADTFGSQSYTRGVLLQLLTVINRIALTGQATGDSTPTFVTDILTYINTHYGEPLSLDALASHFFVSKYYLSHEFKKAVGTGVHRYITLKRLSVAYDLLADGMSPNQAAVQCGFGDYTAFYRAFRAEYGISPAACGK